MFIDVMYGWMFGSCIWVNVWRNEFGCIGEIFGGWILIYLLNVWRLDILVDVGGLLIMKVFL